MDSLTDEQLVALTQGGNAGAFNRLTARWEGHLYRFALRNLGNAEDARDVCQEALLKAYVNIRRLREGSKFKAWAHHIVLNLCRDRFRSAGAKVDWEPYEEGGADEDRTAVELAGTARAAARPDRAVLFRTLEEVFRRLPVEQRSAILLREYQGFTSEEIGEITGVPAATVRSRIFYGLRAARRMLRERGIDSPEAILREGSEMR